jgi:hypothetical protein
MLKLAMTDAKMLRATLSAGNPIGKKARIYSDFILY